MNAKTKLENQDNHVAAALIAGAAMADVITNPHPGGKNAVLVPPGHELTYLDRPDLPLRKSGTVKLSDVASFLLYFEKHGYTASMVYGSIKPAQFVAVLDDHDGDKADWREHRAIYTLTHSDEWMEWTKRNGQPFDGNEAFAVWLENNLVDVVNPDPARLLEISLNMRVNQSQGFTNAVKLENGELKFEYTNNVEGSAKTGANARPVAIPEKFTINIPVFSGLGAEKYKVDARFRYRLNNGQLTLRFELVRPQKVIEQAFKDILDRIEKETKREVLFGTPE